MERLTYDYDRETLGRGQVAAAQDPRARRAPARAGAFPAVLEGRRPATSVDPGRRGPRRNGSSRCWPRSTRPRSTPRPACAAWHGDAVRPHHRLAAASYDELSEEGASVPAVDELVEKLLDGRLQRGAVHAPAGAADGIESLGLAGRGARAGRDARGAPPQGDGRGSRPRVRPARYASGSASRQGRPACSCDVRLVLRADDGRSARFSSPLVHRGRRSTVTSAAYLPDVSFTHRHSGVPK